MPSPFPGMDPWLEASDRWSVVHSTFLIHLSEAINRQLPEAYLATSERLVWVDDTQHLEPDVGVFGTEQTHPRDLGVALFEESGMVAVEAEPILEPWEQTYLEIQSADDERLVTAIELLSPSNKRLGDSGRTAYLQKVAEFRRAGVHLIEIDLLRVGTHSTAVPLGKLRGISTAFDYHLCITLAGEHPTHQVRSFTMPNPMPALVVPLDPGVEAICVELQPIFDQAYEAGRFHKLAKYSTRRPEPPLTPEQQAWAEGILKAKGVLA